MGAPRSDHRRGLGRSNGPGTPVGRSEIRLHAIVMRGIRIREFDQPCHFPLERRVAGWRFFSRPHRSRAARLCVGFRVRARCPAQCRPTDTELNVVAARVVKRGNAMASRLSPTVRSRSTLGFMARIREIIRGTQSIRPHTTEVDCYYDVVHASDGTTLLHLTTFGSDKRQSKPKSSQSIQIDGKIARQLVDLLVTTFPRSVPRSVQRSHDEA